jgi:predicted mannosyl-3-phosphoglycerate phosphatase (HAD superfamily)
MAVDPIARPAAAGTVELADANTRVGSCAPKTAMEMTRLWKSKNDFHSRLEISHSTRDFHIPTAASRISIKKKNKDTRHGPRYAPCHVAQGGTRLSIGE